MLHQTIETSPAQAPGIAAEADEAGTVGAAVTGSTSSKVLALTLAYEGQGFHGFARQPGIRTVQGEVETALGVLLHRPVEIVGAGRTDAGVHALGQVVSFKLSETEFAARSFDKLRNALNALTPDGIVVRKVEEKPEGFSARFSAIEREYRYRLVFDPVEPLFVSRLAWWVPAERPPDIIAMRAGGSYLTGEHDFTSFCVAASAQDKNTVREVKDITIFGTQHLGEDCIVLLVRGNAFLHSMIRIMVGTLLEVALGRKEPAWVGEVLAARNRAVAGQTAPAHGLTFWRVRY
ncbi:MAG: tRNA pseudouridine(38-40) synthase TruA [Coriobacteriales bacterium]|jgi:tRNA pseudouridine38-40 synthase|nr:tRNA pseudouridine(38-40) synthase TruA [Coriobacteriales bacterium]